MQRIRLFIVLVLVVSGWSQSAKPSERKGGNFDGKWWREADADERSGFMNGAGDCLTWTAHEKGFNATPEQLADKISKFYKTHPESASLTVVEVWQRVAPQPKTAKTPEPQGGRSGRMLTGISMVTGGDKSATSRKKGI